MKNNLKLRLDERDAEKINLILGNKGAGKKGFGNTLTDLTPLELLIKINGRCNTQYYNNFLKGLINISPLRTDPKNFFEDPYYLSRLKINILDYKN